MSPLMAWGAAGRCAEHPSGDLSRLEAWCYTDRFSRGRWQRGPVRGELRPAGSPGTGRDRSDRALGIPGPLWGTDRQHLSATLWELPEVGRPGAQTMGLNALGGIYTHYGVACPRSAGGYSIYRPRHWALEGTDLYYGDLLGGPPAYIASYEVVRHDGQLHPRHRHGVQCGHEPVGGGIDPLGLVRRTDHSTVAPGDGPQPASRDGRPATGPHSWRTAARRAARASRRAAQRGWSQIRPRNSTIVCAAR
jgi:hypothetical protein